MTKKTTPVAAVATPVKGGLFEANFNASKEDKRAAKKDIYRDRIKASIEAEYRKAKEAKIDAEHALLTLRQDVDNYDASKIKPYHQTLLGASATMAAMREEYKVMFDEELPNQ